MNIPGLNSANAFKQVYSVWSSLKPFNLFTTSLICRASIVRVVWLMDDPAIARFSCTSETVFMRK